MAIPWNFISALIFWPIFQTSLWNGSLWMRSLVIHQYWQISWSATAPGQKWCSFWALLALGACLPLPKNDIHSEEAWPGLDNPLLFTVHASAIDLRAAQHFHFHSLAHHALARKVPRGCLLMEPHLWLLYSFLWLDLLWTLLLHTGNVGFPLTGWILSVPKGFWYPQILQCHVGRHLRCAGLNDSS